MKTNLKSFVRLLTLISFFHFSGINNGFTALVMTAGTLNRISLAPIIVEKISSALNPLNFKRTFSIQRLIQLCQKSKKVVEFASENILTNLLVETNFNQDFDDFANQVKSSTHHSDKNLKTENTGTQEFQENILLNIEASEQLTILTDHPYRDSWLNKEETPFHKVKKIDKTLTDKLRMRRCFDQSAKLPPGKERYLKKDFDFGKERIIAELTEDDDDPEIDYALLFGEFGRENHPDASSG